MMSSTSGDSLNREKRPSLESINSMAPPPKRTCKITQDELNMLLNDALLFEEDEQSHQAANARVVELQPSKSESTNPSSNTKANPKNNLKAASNDLKLPFSVFKVSNQRKTFCEFVSRWSTIHRYSFSLNYITDHPNSVLGAEDQLFFPETQKILSLSVSWDKSRVFYINLKSTRSERKTPTGDDQSQTLDLTTRLQMIKSVLEMSNTEKICFDAKPQLKLLLQHDIKVYHGIRDPRIGAWVLQPDLWKDVSIDELLREMQTESISSRAFVLHTSDAFNTDSPCQAEIALRRSLLMAHKSVVIFPWLESKLREKQLFSVFGDIEMKMLPILAKMEFYGVGFDCSKLLQFREQVEMKLKNLKKRAFNLCGREFDLESPSEVKHILFEVLQLEYPSLKYVDSPEKSLKKKRSKNIESHGSDGQHASLQVSLQGMAKTSSIDEEENLGGPMRTKRVEKSTKAEILNVMKNSKNPHPIIDIILEHRMLQHSINNYMDPLPKYAFFSQRLQMDRIFSTCHQTCVPTGRLAFDHPNLQSIRHAFEFIPVKTAPKSLSVSSSISPIKTPPKVQHFSSTPIISTGVENDKEMDFSDRKDDSKAVDSPTKPFQQLLCSLSSSSPPTSDSSSDYVTDSTPIGTPIEVNIRDAFIAAPGMTLVSLDYCQLEFRLMAHFAQDSQLIKELSEPGSDLFTIAAAKWLDKTSEEVTGEERSRTKHIIYGILYGMGSASLSRILETSIPKAKRFKQSFEEKFDGITKLLKKIGEKTAEKGFTTTIANRRREFPEIYSKGSSYARALRQATNSVIQGSAADIVKTVTIKIEEYFREKYPEARCIINLHDELVFEIPTQHLDEIIPEIQFKMENTYPLTVPLPVRIHIGPSWGHLKMWTKQ